MRRSLPVPASCCVLAAIAPVLLFGLASHCAAQQPAPAAPPAETHQLPVSPKINALAHRVLVAGIKSNALGGNELKPWHIKIDYQIANSPTAKPVSGTVEEWHLSQFQWRRTFTGGIPTLNGSEWSVSRFEHFAGKRDHNSPGLDYYANLRIARPVIDPLYQAGNIKPDYDMEILRTKADPVLLNCVSVVNAKQYAPDTNPDWLFPTMCFDQDIHLRLTKAGETTVQFDDLQLFQGRAVARDVKVIDHGRLLSAMKVTALEPWDGADLSLIQPPKDAVRLPYVIEPGQPQPEPVYEVGAHVPLQPNGMPWRGVAPIEITIHKDGSVSMKRDSTAYPFRDVLDSIELAVKQWKYKPYVVDGQAVEVEYSILYPLDSKFVPSYDRAKPGPDDYWSAFDPKRDPVKDLELAKAAATAGHKRILVDVGGTWCVWCTLMDQFLAMRPEVKKQIDANFVFMKVNVSAGNENEAFLNQFPKIPGYPHLFVLDSNGKLIESKSTNDLEDGGGYSVLRFSDFLKKASQETAVAQKAAE